MITEPIRLVKLIFYRIVLSVQFVYRLSPVNKWRKNETIKENKQLLVHAKVFNYVTYRNK